MPESTRDIQELEREIQLLKDEKARLDKMKGRLFSIVSHDIKSPLGILVGFADVLMRHVDDNYETKEDVQLQQIKGYLNDGKTKILTLLENLVHWVKIENGSVPYRASEVKIASILEQVASELKTELGKKDINLQVNCPDEITCFGDSITFKVILKNLLDNAIKYSEANAQIGIEAKEENGTTAIHMEDHGIGMTEEIQSQIFEANKDKIKPGTAGEQGIGLGLPVVLGFVRLNSGDISVKSESTNGTSVVMTFPSKAPAEADS